MNKPYIICSAIWYNDGKKHSHQPKNIETGYVICGRRHHNCIGVAYVFGVKTLRIDIQGFLTSDDNFVNRKEAIPIALNAGQITKKESESESLDSEELY